MSDLVSASNKWRYVIKITSRDFPIASNAQLVMHLKNLWNKNFIPAFRVTFASNQYLDLTNRNGRPALQDIMYKHQLEARDGMLRFRRTSYHKTLPPGNQTLFYSESPYYLATRDFVFHILCDEMARNITNWFEDVKDPDVYVWGTLDHSPRAPGRGSGPRTHPGFPQIVATKIAPVLQAARGKETTARCEGYYQNGYCVLSVGDLQWLLKQNSLFAGDFNIKYDHFVIQCIQRRIFHNKHT